MATLQSPGMMRLKPNMKKTKCMTSAPIYTFDQQKKMKKKQSWKHRLQCHGSAMRDTFESLQLKFNQNDVSDDENSDSSISRNELRVIDEKTESQNLRKLPSLNRSRSTPIVDIKHFEIDSNSLTIYGNHETEIREVYNRLMYTKRSTRIDIAQNDTTKNDQNHSNQDEFHEIDDDEFLDDGYFNELDDEYHSELDEEYEDITDNKVDNEEIRQYLIKEIIDTEESYVCGLSTLLYEFIQPIFNQKMIKLQFEDIVTGNIPQILSFHKDFLAQLQSKYAEAVNKIIAGEAVIALFYKLCNKKFVEMYALYTMQYNSIMDVFGGEKKNKKLQKYLKNKRKQRKPLTNHLILPIQRVTRYSLLLRELLAKTDENHGEYTYLQHVLIKINAMVTAVNEKQKEIENLSQCLVVQETVSGLNRNIVCKNRIFLAQFLFRKHENQRGRQFFVFNDMIIITNIKLKCKVVLEMRTLDIKKKEDGNKIIVFRVTSINHEARYETDGDKASDIDKLVELIDANRSDEYRKSLTSIGAHGSAKLLKTQSLSQSDAYRQQIKLKKNSVGDNSQSKANQLLAKTNLANMGNTTV